MLQISALYCSTTAGFAAIGVLLGHLTWPLLNFPILSSLIGPDQANTALKLGAGCWITEIYRFLPLPNTSCTASSS